MKALKPYLLLISLILFHFLPSKTLSSPPPAEGDWIITGEEMVENETVSLNGNLIVKDGGSLTLRNVTLIINNTYEGQYRISADPGSCLAILDSKIHPSNLEYGFYILVQDASFEMKDSEVRGLGYSGIALQLEDLQGAVIHGSVIEYMDSIAINLKGVTDSEISNNTVTSLGEEPDSGGININNSHDNIIVDNTITASGHYLGMMFFGSTGNYVANNDLWSGPTGYLGHGILLDRNANNNVFKGNTIRGPTGCTGFRVFSLNNLIQGNTVHDMRFGVVIGAASGNIVANNSFYNISDDDAVLVYRSHGNFVINNHISSAVRGITLSNFSRENTIQGNTVSTVSNIGISLHFSSDNNVVTNNSVSDSPFGIIVRQSANNLIYNNNFVGNTQQGYDDGTNSWSFDGRGNFWNDYQGVDKNSDGIGDPSYDLPPMGIDEYPLIDEVAVVTAPVPEPGPLVFREIPQELEITNEVKVENQEIVLDKSYIIKEGGILVLKNTTLRSANSLAWPYEIRVEAGGSLYILNSKITALETGDSPIFINTENADANSTVEIRNSELRHVDGGMRWGGPAGTAIFARDGFVIENNVIADSDHGVDLWGTQGAYILNNTFYGILRGAFRWEYGAEAEPNIGILNNSVDGNEIYDAVLDPTVTTGEATEVTTDRATLSLRVTLPDKTSWFDSLGGEMISDEFLANNLLVGAYDSVEVFFQYRKVGDSDWMSTQPFTYDVPCGTNEAVTTKNHTDTVTGLEPYIVYEFRARITYNDTTFNGRTYGFITNDSDGAPRLYVEPDIKANGSNHSIIVSVDVPVSITVGFDFDGYASQNADWWVVQATPSGTLNYFDLSTGSMVQGFLPTHQGPLFNLGSTQLLKSSDLTVGTHTFYFGVDLKMNGSLDMSYTYYDWVNVNVTGP